MPPCVHGARAGADFLLQPPPGSKLVAGIVDVHSMTLDVDGALHALRCVCVDEEGEEDGEPVV